MLLLSPVYLNALERTLKMTESNLFGSTKTLTYAEVEAKISQIMMGNAFGKKVKELTDELKKDAKIVIK